MSSTKLYNLNYNCSLMTEESLIKFIFIFYAESFMFVFFFINVDTIF